MTLVIHQAVYKSDVFTLSLGGANLDNNVDTDTDTDTDADADADADGVDNFTLQSDRHTILSGQYDTGSLRIGVDTVKGDADDEGKAYVAQLRYHFGDPMGLRLYYYYVEALSAGLKRLPSLSVK